MFALNPGLEFDSLGPRCAGGAPTVRRTRSLLLAELDFGGFGGFFVPGAVHFGVVDSLGDPDGEEDQVDGGDES